MTTIIETLLRSEFNFGFELEGYIPKDVANSLYNTDIHGKMTGENYIHGKLMAKKWLQNKFQLYFGNNLTIKDDGSLIQYPLQGFEFPTPVMPLTPYNIQRCIDFLTYCKKDLGIFTTKDCGFHVHFSFPEMSPQDVVWIVCQIALNDSYFNLLTKFHDIEFTNENFASPDFLEDIRNCFNEADGINYSGLNLLLNKDKYRLLRIHPQGTLEWRGPRDFLNGNQNISLIKDFFITVLNVAKMFSDCLDKKTIDGIDRRTFEKLVDFSQVEKEVSQDFINTDKFDTIINKILNHPHIVATIRRGSYIYKLIRDLEKLSPEAKEEFVLKLGSYCSTHSFRDSSLLSPALRLFPELANYLTTRDLLICVSQGVISNFSKNPIYSTLLPEKRAIVNKALKGVNKSFKSIKNNDYDDEDIKALRSFLTF